MLKRIAVLSKDQKLLGALSRSVKGKSLEVVEAASPAKLPPATATVATDGNDTASLVKAASVLGARQEQVLELLAEAIDCREGFAPGSSSRVCAHATRLAKALKLSAADQLTLERAALVRDIGKLKIPNDTLLKDDVLTYDEWQLIHQHTSIGADLVAKLDALKDTAAIVRSHHECFDGTGYPKGLEGDRIPYLARAMKVLDVYCAMTSARHYRKGQTTHASAIAHLKKESGKHFDPTIVEAFVKANVGKAD